MTSLPPPPSVGKLEKYVLAHATRAGLAVGRVRHWISFMMISAALERASDRPDGPRFVVKGGVALELRLGRRARATDDKDGRVLVVEYKGAHLFSDADEKRAVGAVWASRSGGRCVFAMPTDEDFSPIVRAVRGQ